MDAEELELYTGLYHSIIVNDQKNISKGNAIKLRDIYNKYNEEPVTYCMCSRMQRMNLTKNKFFKWFDSLNEEETR